MGKEGKFCDQVLGGTREQRKEKQADTGVRWKCGNPARSFGVGADTTLSSVASFWFQPLEVLRACHQPYQVSWGAWIPVLRLYCKSKCCSITKMQSCFSQLQRELEMTSLSIVSLLDSTLKCILQHTVQGLADWFIYCTYVQVSHICTMINGELWGLKFSVYKKSLQQMLFTLF